jgi:hypothetical protein
MMRTILLASVAAAALATPAWAIPDRYEGVPGCVGASGIGCTQDASLIQTNQGNRPSETDNAEVASTESAQEIDESLQELGVSRAALAQRDITDDDDEDVTDEVGDTAEEVGDEAEEVGDDIADAASEFGDEVGDVADDVGDEIDDAFD